MKNKLIGLLISLIVRFLMLLCRKTVFGQQQLEQYIKQSSGKALIAIWHYCLLYSAFHFRNRNVAVMISRSGDGDIGAQFLYSLGYPRAPRGSSGSQKGGKQALNRLISHVEKGNIGAVVTDGQTGPPHISKHGIIAAAAKTGAPILPHVWFAKPCIRIKSWDRTVIPKPFSRIIMIHDKQPIFVPQNADRQTIEKYREQLDYRLSALTYQAQKWFELKDKYPDPRDIPVPDFAELNGILPKNFIERN